MSRISAWLSGALDPVKLARQVGMKPDKWQADVLRSTAPRLHLNCSRQVGKSTVTSLVALHRALYTPNAVVLLISPTERQSAELFRKVGGFYRALGKPIEPEAENVHALRLENGSRILSLPASESGIRGFTADLIVIDEASRVPDELYATVSPMLAVSGGRLVAMSTPAGRRGWWYDATLSDKWTHVTVPATECPRISAEFLAEERERLGESAFRQEYACEFVDASGAAFSGDDIAAIFADATRPPSAGAEQETVSAAAREIDLARQVARLERRRRDPERGRRAQQRACEHRWRYESPHDCMWCGLLKEEAAC